MRLKKVLALLLALLLAVPAAATLRVSGAFTRTPHYAAVSPALAQSLHVGLRAAFPGDFHKAADLGAPLAGVLKVDHADAAATQSYAPLAHQLTEVFEYTPQTLAAKAAADPKGLRDEIRLAMEEAESRVIDGTYDAIAEMTPYLNAPLSGEEFDHFGALVGRLNKYEQRYAAYLARGADDPQGNLAQLRKWAKIGRERLAELRAEITMGAAQETAAALADGAVRPEDIAVATARTLDFSGDWGELLQKLDMARQWFAGDRKQAPPKSIKIMSGGSIKGMYEFKLNGANERLFFRWLPERKQIVLIHHANRGDIKAAGRDRLLTPFMDDAHTILSIAPQQPAELRPLQRITRADLDIRLNPK